MLYIRAKKADDKVTEKGVDAMKKKIMSDNIREQKADNQR